MRNALVAASIPPLLLLVVCICIARGADDPDLVSCPDSCAGSRKNCELSCSQIVGGGAAGVERAKCENACVNELEKCRSLCSNPTPAPVIDPGVYENNPCSGECSSELEKCEGTCAMFSGEGENGGKRGECTAGCKDAEYNCLEACPR